MTSSHTPRFSERTQVVVLTVSFAVLLLVAGAMVLTRIPTKEDSHRYEGSDVVETHRRQAIEEAYPAFTVDYEAQPCFAGCSVRVAKDGRDFYYAFITHASGLPVGIATCFKVDPMLRVYKIGEFSDMTDSYMGYTDVDPMTCRGIR